MARFAGHVACVTLLLALPSLRVLCIDSCASAPGDAVTRADEPACHDSRGRAPAPADPAGGCTHGDASTSPVVRPVATAAPDEVETFLASWWPHPRPGVAPRPVVADRPVAPAYLPSAFLPPLRR